MTRLVKGLALVLAILAIGAGLLVARVASPEREPAGRFAQAGVEVEKAPMRWTPPVEDTVPARPPRTAAPPPTRTPAPAATADPHLVVITEDDITKAIASGAGAQQGATLENLKVRFADGQTHITADSVGYGFIQMANLDLMGRLTATNGALSLAVESISPGGLAASVVPAVANQALAQYTSQWYIEEVRTLPGRLELRVR